MSEPTISCVIPVYNAEAFVAVAVESVLGQTRPPEEVIVVDDGSTDGTAAVLDRFGTRVRVIRQANAGCAAARNTGVAAATGRWLALVDADDWWLPEKTERMLAALAAAPDVSLVYSGRWVHEAETDRRHEPPLVCSSGDVYHRLLAGNVVPTSSVLVRRDAWQAAGGMEPTLGTCEDWDLWLRLARQNAFLGVPERLCVYRAHGGGISQAGVARMRADERRVLQRAFAADPDVPRRVRRRAWAAHHFRCGMDAYMAGEFRAARKRFRATLAQAWHAEAVRRYVETFLGRRVLAGLRRTADSWG